MLPLVYEELRKLAAHKMAREIYGADLTRIPSLKGGIGANFITQKPYELNPAVVLFPEIPERKLP